MSKEEGPYCPSSFKARAAEEATIRSPLLSLIHQKRKFSLHTEHHREFLFCVVRIPDAQAFILLRPIHFFRISEE